MQSTQGGPTWPKCQLLLLIGGKDGETQRPRECLPNKHSCRALIGVYISIALFDFQGWVSQVARACLSSSHGQPSVDFQRHSDSDPLVHAPQLLCLDSSSHYLLEVCVKKWHHESCQALVKLHGRRRRDQHTISIQ